MTPQRFASVHHRNRPVARIAPFRDDTGLVGLRYEETKQAEPPIPLPPLPHRNPQRTAQLNSSVRLSSSTSTASRSNPIVIPPPAVAPPQEKHPLFRAQPTAVPQTQGRMRTKSEEWKRDSGLAPTTSSGTIREEDEEQVPVVVCEYSVDALGEMSAVAVRSGSLEPKPRKNCMSFPVRGATPNLRMFTIPLRHPSPETPPESPTCSDKPSFPSDVSSKNDYSIGLRPGAARQRRMRLAEARAAPVEVTTLAQQARGSLKGLKSTKSPPRRTSWSDKRKNESDETVASSNHFCLPSINTQLDDNGFWEDLGDISFSKRGSVMFGGKRAIRKHVSSVMASANEHSVGPKSDGASSVAAAMHHTNKEAPSAAPVTVVNNVSVERSRIGNDAASNKSGAATGFGSPKTSLPSSRLLSVDAEKESQKVRSLYEFGDGLNWQDGSPVPSSFSREAFAPTRVVPSEDNAVSSSRWPGNAPLQALATHSLGSFLSLQHDSLPRGQYELAGGLEDWENIEVSNVDRYGFIMQGSLETRSVAPGVDKALLSPRRRNVLTKRPDPAYSSSPTRPIRVPNRKVSAKSLNTCASEMSHASRRSTRSSLRMAANMLPHNKERRWMDDAGEMLTMQPGLADIAEDDQASKVADELKRKEWERSEKWHKMAKVVRRGKDGEGMNFEFDTRNPKLVERTWKGIPDRWRAAAWHSFLLTSAKRWKRPESDEEIISEFQRLQDLSCSDDTQIDLDVPRTINRHIMFRKRYRGGQRLLFRVLHAIALYYPNTGYVQGMASLAATLLCYYDEERCFVMMVRMWKFRGLERLYQPGFAGLMSTLQDFEKLWLADKDVVRKLSELCIDTTAYGTRWYLTLFNLSIPFPAQLRVWDVFMLLGDCPPEPSPRIQPQALEERGCKDMEKGGEKEKSRPRSPRGLDVLHATGAAIIHALRDVLLDSDFENAMKALTSWVPIKDEELLMKVARGVWKRHSGKRKEKISRVLEGS